MSYDDAALRAWREEKAKRAAGAAPLPCDECGGDQQTGHQRLCSVLQKAYAARSAAPTPNPHDYPVCVDCKQPSPLVFKYADGPVCEPCMEERCDDRGAAYGAAPSPSDHPRPEAAKERENDAALLGDRPEGERQTLLPEKQRSLMEEHGRNVEVPEAVRAEQTRHDDLLLATPRENPSQKVSSGGSQGEIRDVSDLLGRKQETGAGSPSYIGTGERMDMQHLQHGLGAREGELENTSKNGAVLGQVASQNLSTCQKCGVTYNGGHKCDSGRARISLLPMGPLMEVAEVYGIGSRKYSDNNWRKGMTWDRLFSAMMRHAFAFWAGEERDPIDGQTHLSSVVFCALTLMEYRVTHPELDNRPTNVSWNGTISNVRSEESK